MPFSCYPVSLPACPDNIGISAGLEPVSIYRYEITTKFAIVYNGVVMTNELGIMFIPVSINEYMPPALFNQYAGTFTLRVFKQALNNSFEPAMFVIDAAEYDILELSFKIYKPAIGAFDPSNPVYVPVDDGEVHIVDDIAMRDTLTLTRNTFVYVRDATGDGEVPEGNALYLFDKVNSSFIRITSPTLLSSSLLLD